MLSAEVLGMARIETIAEYDGGLAGGPIATLTLCQAEIGSDVCYHR
tara:strand:- start:166 stop:303 length:138 start_codon:yes stop_codon:yes gene_type:complete